jgi:hypothetical protein
MGLLESGNANDEATALTRDAERGLLRYGAVGTPLPGARAYF